MDHLEYGPAALYRELGRARLRCYCPDIHRIEGLPNFYSFATGEYGWTVRDGRLVPEAHGFIGNASRFLQRWLYFEVLREVFHGVPGFNVNDFVGHVTSGHSTDLCLSTRLLRDLLYRWRDSIQQAQPRHWAHIARVQDVLSYAKHITMTYCAVLESNTSDYSIAWDNVEEDAILSIMLLGEVLTEALRKIQQQIGFSNADWNILSSTSCGWGYSSLVLKTLSEKNWPLETIRHLRVRLKGNTNALLYVLVSLDPIITQNITGPSYTPRHLCPPPHKCQAIRPARYNDVLSIIRNNETPLFRYDPQATNPANVLTVTKYSGKPETYIVVSHVWADGFGNPRANELNECVLQRFSEIFAQGRRLGECSSPTLTLLFWIDTLGIPVADSNRAERIQAIGRMHEIYREARATFVLDNGIMSQDRDDRWVNAAMRISLGNWMRRLWTLQEAVLSQELYFVFRNRATSIQDLELDNDFRDRDDTLQGCIAEVAYQYRRCMLRSEPTDRHQRLTSDFVGKVWQAAQWRTTTHRHHETLSLATLFGLDTTSFASASNREDQDNEGGRQRFENYLNERMKRLLELLTKQHACIPAGFLFLPPPHLPYKGLRWAPRSWLSETPVENPDIYPMQGPGCNTINESGLCAELPGFMLRELEHNLSLLIEAKGFYFTAHQDLHDWYYIERLNFTGNDLNGRLEPWLNVGGIEPTEVAVIHLPHRVSDEQQIALLVSVIQQDEKRKFGIILSRVKISRVVDLQTITQQQADFRNIEKGPLCYGVVLGTVEWVIDGPDLASGEGDNIDHPENMAPGVIPRVMNRLANLSRSFGHVRRRWASRRHTNTDESRLQADPILTQADRFGRRYMDRLRLRRPSQSPRLSPSPAPPS